ncbi:MAG: hypothetical protein KF770_07275 [Anaerolineae bacterium]|nr:hypothetical protein [Anaerolineae bacterium]
MNQEQDFGILTRQLHAWNGRRRLREALIWLPRGLLVGLLAAVVVAAVARLRPLLTNQEVAYVALALAGVGLLAAAAWLLWQRHPLPEQARFADRQFLLQERASTAVEIHNGLITTSPLIAEQQLNDTLTAVRQVDTRALLPFRLNRQDWLVIVAAVLLLVTAVVLPNLQEAELLRQRGIDKAIAEQINQLEALSEEIRQNPLLTDEQKEEILQPIEQAIEGLGAGDISQEQAVATLSEAEAELRSLAANSSAEQLRQQLQQAGEPLANNPNSQSLGQSLQNGNLAQAGAAATQLADQLPELSREEQMALAEDLMATAQSLVGTDDQLAQQLAQAAQALQNGDIAAAQQALREAGATLQQRAQEAAAANQANQAANALGEGRQSVAQAGGQPPNPDNLLPPNDGRAGPNDGLGQSPQPGPGQGNGQGQGEGDGSGQGQGQNGGQPGGQLGGLGGPGPGGGHVENVYVPEMRDLGGFEGVDIELPAQCRVNPADCGALLNERATEFGNETSIVPYTQVFGDYRNAANEALQDDYIPLGLKGYIRDYFSSLEP